MKHAMKKSRLLVVLFAVSLMLGVFALDATASAASAKLNKKKVTLAVAMNTTLKVTGTTAKVTWSSSKKSVATVNGKGKVTAKKKGTTTITAKVGKKKLTCKVTVKDNIKKIYTKEQLNKASTWEKVKKTNQSLFCSTAYEVSYNSKGKMVMKIAVGNLDPKKNWNLDVMSVQVKDKKGNLIAYGSYKVPEESSYLKPGYCGFLQITLDGKNSKTKKVIDLRNTKFVYDIVVN